MLRHPEGLHHSCLHHNDSNHIERSTHRVCRPRRTSLLVLDTTCRKNMPLAVDACDTVQLVSTKPAAVTVAMTLVSVVAMVDPEAVDQHGTKICVPVEDRLIMPSSLEDGLPVGMPYCSKQPQIRGERTMRPGI